MRHIISKELLSEVLNKDCEICGITDNNELKYTSYSDQFNERHYINVYELAHKCKEWASKQSIHLISYYKCYPAVKNKGYCQIHHTQEYIDKPFSSFDEQQAVFDACQWILEEKGDL